MVVWTMRMIKKHAARYMLISSVVDRPLLKPVNLFLHITPTTAQQATEDFFQKKIIPARFPPRKTISAMPEARSVSQKNGI